MFLEQSRPLVQTASDVLASWVEPSAAATATGVGHFFSSQVLPELSGATLRWKEPREDRTNGHHAHPTTTALGQ